MSTQNNNTKLHDDSFVQPNSLYIDDRKDSEATAENGNGSADQSAPAPGSVKYKGDKEPEYGPKGEKIAAYPVPFKCFGKTTRIKLDKLGSLLSQLLSQKFHDFVGISIDPTPSNRNGVEFVTKMYFEDNQAPLGSGEIKNLENLVVVNKNNFSGDMLDMTHVLNNRYTGRTYKLTMQTRQLLAPFMYGKFNSNHPKDRRWENGTLVKEIVMSPYSYQYPAYRMQNAERILIEVSNFDIKELLRLLYGNSSMVIETIDNGDGSVTNLQAKKTTYYDIRFIKYDSYGVPIVNIEQFDKEAVESIIISENPPLRSMNGNVFYYSAPKRG
jgi:hypothetical protein